MRTGVEIDLIRRGIRVLSESPIITLPSASVVLVSESMCGRFRCRRLQYPFLCLRPMQMCR